MRMYNGFFKKNQLAKKNSSGAWDKFLYAMAFFRKFVRLFYDETGFPPAREWRGFQHSFQISRGRFQLSKTEGLKQRDRRKKQLFFCGLYVVKNGEAIVNKLQSYGIRQSEVHWHESEQYFCPSPPNRLSILKLEFIAMALMWKNVPYISGILEFYAFLCALHVIFDKLMTKG